MKSSFVILSIVCTLLIAATYSSSARVFAVENTYTMSCSYTKDKKTAFCSDNDPTNNDLWRCDKQKNGTWKCGKVVAMTGGGLPSDLKKGLTDAQSVTQEPTKNFKNKLNSSDFSSLETQNTPTKNMKDKLNSSDISSLEK